MKVAKQLRFGHLREVTTCCNPSLPFSIPLPHTACVINTEMDTRIVLITTHKHKHTHTHTHGTTSTSSRPTAFHSFHSKDTYTSHCTYDLFDGAVNNSGYIASNCRMDNEW